MKVLIWDDIEGIAGICDSEHGFEDDTHKQLTTMEVNAAINGLLKAGVSEIDIFDGHAMGDNLILEDLNPAANYLGGGWMVTLADLIRTDKLRQYDALVLIGQHAQTGTKDGFIAHTNSSFTALRINGQPVGEIEQAGWLAGHFDVPLIFVSGDYAAVKEANHFFPEIETVSVKKKEEDVFVCRPKEEVYKETEEKIFGAMSRLKEFKPYTCENPITVEVLFTLKEIARRLSFLPGYDQNGERGVSYHAKDYLEAFWAYHGCRPIISAIMDDYRAKLLKRIVEECNLDRDEVNPIVVEIQNEMMDGAIPLPEVEF